MLNVKIFFYLYCLHQEIKENRLINDLIRKAVQTDVGLRISIHATAHGKIVFRKKWLDCTLPLLMSNPTLPQL